MRSAFLGTPSAAVPALAALVDVSDAALVVTRPDRPAGRRSVPVAPPVKVAASQWGIPVAQPANRRELHAVLEEAAVDIAVVVAFGMLIPVPTLAITRFGFVNVHFSLLPRWRGAAPVERAILAGDTTTGVSLMHLDEGLDTGPVISVAETTIDPDDTGGSLTARLSHLGAELLAENLEPFAAGGLVPAPQMHAAATQAPRLEPIEGLLDPTEDAESLLRRIRAFHPRPGAYVVVEGRRLAVRRAWYTEPAPEQGVIAPDADGVPVLGTAAGGVALIQVRPEGRDDRPGKAWMNGRRGAPAHVDT